MNATRNDSKNEQGKAAAPRSRFPGRIPALVAAGSVCALLGNPAAALELGQINVESSIGQPLRASIAYALQPNEALSEYCIFVRGGNPNTGLPPVTRARVAVTNSRIELRGATPLLEPLMSLQLSIDCPYTANLTRSYLLMISPPSAMADANANRAPAPVAAIDDESPVREAARAPVERLAGRSPRRSVQRSTTGKAGSDYRVQPGDTLSGIAAGIRDRKAGLWQAVQALYDANPGAFIGDDMNRLKAGVTITIPASLGAASSVPANTAVAETPRTAMPSAATTVDSTYPGLSRAATATAAPAPSVSVIEPDVGDTTATSNSDNTNDVRPVRADTTGTAPAARTPVVQAARPVPVVGNRVGADNVSGRGSVSWLMWLGGSGVAIILALLLFGRGLRERFGSLQQTNGPLRRRRTDRGEEPEAGDALDLEIPLAATGSRSLDADLGDGSGFDQTGDMDVAEDYGFGGSGDYSHDVDLDIGDSVDDEEPKQATDMLPAMSMRLEDSVIVDQEILPGDDTSYDMSMIVDVTKQNFENSDASAHDLQAIPVSSLDEDGSEDDTANTLLNDETAYQILEQDYEDELTATQALNKEIAEAAMQLKREIGTGDDDLTARLPGGHDAPRDLRSDSMAQDLESTAEITAEMPSQDRAVNDDGSGIELTLEMPADQEETTVDMLPPHNDATVELPTDQNADTLEMPPARRHSGSRKKSKAS